MKKPIVNPKYRVLILGIILIAFGTQSTIYGQVPVPSNQETVAASTTQPLTEATLNGSVVTLTLRGATYASSIFDVPRNVSVSGIAGVSVGAFAIQRVSDTVVTVELTFNGDFDTNGTLTFTVGAGAIADYNGAPLTATLSVTALEESVVASTTQPLTEATLNGSVVTLTLRGRSYASFIFDVLDNVTVSGITGVSVGTFGIDRKSDTVATVELMFNGDFDTNGTLTFTVGAGALANYNGAPLTATLSVTALQESVVASTTQPLTEATLNGSVVTLTLRGRSYASFIFDVLDNVTVSGITGVSVGTFGIDRKSDTVATVELTFNGNMTTDGTLTFTVGAGALANYNGAPLTATSSVTADSGPGPAPPPNPNQAPTFSEGTSATRSFAENTGAGQNIGNPVRATDSDGGTLTYGLQGTDAGSFTIVSNSGQLRTKSGITYDFETKNRYEVTVQVSDGQGGNATIVVTINLTDVSETPVPTGPCASGGAVPNAANNPGLVSDCEALLDARDPLRGTATLNWSASTSIATWDGVTLEDTPQRVTKLRFQNKGLNGTIPAQLSRLTNLKELYLTFNQLSGTIPAELGRLTSLTHLGLLNNQLSGTIPSELSNLTNLRQFALQHNQLSGTIPIWLDNLTRLRILNLQGNRLSGSIPVELGRLTDLWQLLLFENRLSGTIPKELGNLSLLQEMRLDNNQLTGNIPTELTNLTRLTLLHLADNSLTGCVPASLRNISINDLKKLNLPDCSGTQTQLTADFNGDDRVDFADFFEFVDAFGGNDPRFDLDGNGIVDFADFFEFVDAFGS